MSAQNTTTDISESNDDTKSTKSTKSKEEESKVISIHNLLQKTRLSPNDAAWLHSKIDQVTHDRHDGSLSYIGPSIPLRAASQSAIIQSLHFDDSATENSFKSHHSIYSPLRINKSNVIPSTSIPSSRYAPNPGSYHVVNNKHLNNLSVIGVDNKKRRRKRSRTAVFDSDDDQILDEPQQRKKMRYNVSATKSAYIRRKPFRDNYLRPINSMSTYKVPKYKMNEVLSDNEKDTKTKAVQKERIEKKIENEEQQQKQTKMNTDDVNEEKNGFCFVDNSENINNAKAATNINTNTNTDTVTPSLIEEDENKPLKRRRNATKRRSPLKPKINNNSSNTLTTKPITVNDEGDNDNDEDDDMDKEKEKEKDKLNDDDEISKEDLEKLKKEIGESSNNENSENKPIIRQATEILTDGVDETKRLRPLRHW